MLYNVIIIDARKDPFYYQQFNEDATIKYILDCIYIRINMPFIKETVNLYFYHPLIRKYIKLDENETLKNIKYNNNKTVQLKLLLR